MVGAVLKTAASTAAPAQAATPNDLPTSIVRRLGYLKQKRSIHETAWRECYDYTFPLRGSGLQQTQLDATSGAEKRANLLDSTGTDSAKILASAIVSGTTPASSLWFKMALPNATQEQRAWFDENSTTLWRLIHNSNFDAPAFECAIDMACAGWFALYIDENRAAGGFNFEQWPIAQVYCAASRPGGAIDTVFREYTLTAEQCCKEFGEDRVSAETCKLAKEKPDDLVTLVHAIYPRTTYVVGGRLAKNLPIASCHVEVKSKHQLRESGYHEFPVIVPRWMLIPDSVYGVGPAYDALPDMKMLNTLEFDELANADIAIAGMWIAEDDGVLNPRTVKVGPRKIITANSVDSMKRLEAGGDWQLAEYIYNKKVAQIRKVFMADQLEPQDAPGDKTAYEVYVRVALLRQLLGPTYGRLQAEYLKLLLDRCSGIAMRAGAFTSPPESLADRTLDVQYLSPLARAQSMEEVAAMDQHETVLLNESEAVPTVLDTYDWDEAARERGRLLGVPAKLIRSPKQIATVRKARTEAQAQAEQQALTQDVVATAAPKVIERAAGA